MSFKKVIFWSVNVVAGRTGEWLGLFKVQSLDPEKKPIFVCDTDERPENNFNVAQVNANFVQKISDEQFLQRL